MGKNSDAIGVKTKKKQLWKEEVNQKDNILFQVNYADEIIFLKNNSASLKTRFLCDILSYFYFGLF